MPSVRCAWEGAFKSYVIGPLSDDPVAAEVLDAGDLDARRELARRGLVGRHDAARVSLAEAFLYQRPHADANRKWFAELGVAAVKGDLLVVDLGCGAGTVAVALGELFDAEGVSVPHRYVGVDHNQHAVALCSAMLGTPGVVRSDGTWSVYVSLDQAVQDAIAWMSASTTTVVSASYLFRQGLTDTSLAGLVNAVTRIVHEQQTYGVGQVCFLGVDASTTTPPSCLSKFLSALEAAGVEVKRCRSEEVIHGSFYCNFRPEQFGGLVVKPFPQTATVPNLDRWMYLLR